MSRPRVRVLVIAVLSALVLAGGAVAAQPALRPPTNVKASAITSTSLVLSWSAVPSASSYDVYAGTYQSHTSATSVTFTGLTPCTTYALGVRSRGKKSVSAWVTLIAKTAGCVTTPAPPTNTVQPTISGTAQQGDQLTADPGTWTGDTPVTFSYAWSDGQTGKSITLGSADVGQNISVTVKATNSAGNSSATSASVGPVTAATILQPVGDPLGLTWTQVFGDEFNGTSIDTSKWVALNGWGNNNVTSNAKNCTESGGNLILALPGDGTGCDLYSSQKYGAGANAHDLLVGDYLEARIWFPGPGSSPTSTLDNWPAFWAYDGSGNWLAGENDIAEALGHLEYNYHATSGSTNINLSPPGNWGNSWHVYGIYRTATQVQVFYDGVLVGTQPTSDNGGPESIMFTSGKTNACCGAPAVYGSAGNVLVDWVREWN